MSVSNENARPVFVVGAARSGTTWVQCLIGAMENFYSCPETHFFDELLPRELIRGGYQLHRPRYRSQSRRIGKNHLLEIFEKCDRGFLRVPTEARRELLAEASAGKLEVRTLLERLIADCSPPHGTKGRWVEKTPTHASYLDELFNFFPEAQVVCVVRAPEAVLESAARMFHVPISIAAIDYWRSYRDVRRFLECHPAHRPNMFLMTYERLLEGNEELEALGRFLGVRGFDPVEIRNKASRLFADIYRNTLVYRVQEGMDRSPKPAASEKPRTGALTRSAARVAGRILRTRLRLADLPAAPAAQEHRLVSAIAMLVDLGRGVGYAARWRANDLAQQVVSRVKGSGASHVQ